MFARKVAPVISCRLLTRERDEENKKQKKHLVLLVRQVASGGKKYRTKRARELVRRGSFRFCSFFERAGTGRIETCLIHLWVGCVFCGRDAPLQPISGGGLVALLCSLDSIIL